MAKTVVVVCAAAVVVVAIAFLSTPVDGNKIISYGVMMPDVVIPRQEPTIQRARNYNGGVRWTAEPPLAPPPEVEGGAT
ncbi:hypothetical protein MIMGU_mgv1a017390mg [Erythranthe guttata]|uniref:Uncharacterized protein n=1 Tax=Erythranthe guttata TaxID=4155 RepID=A0A022RPY9_ERYGU|nr:hypothetical protein MIMGU_mgv1a017390mg [Erythranthe guttata]